MLYDPMRHEPLGGRVWNPGHVRDAVAGIVRDAEAAFDRARTGEARWDAVWAASAEAAQVSDRCGLVTGDIGAALLAEACLDGGDHRFPGLADL